MLLPDNGDSSGNKAIRALIAFGLTLTALGVTQVFTSVRLFSSFFAYRYQTDALLAGRLALQELPFGHQHDWVLGNGMHQLWGLGIPLLRLPFEALSQFLFGAPFPDRVVLALFLFFAAWLLFPVLAPREGKPGWQRVLITSANLSLFVFSPALISLFATRFRYEEAVAGACIWTFIVIAMLFRFVQKRDRHAFYWIFALSGFATLFRPTAVFYAASALVVALWFAARQRFGSRIWLVALALFAIGPAIQLTTNQLRFGSPFEFGYNLNLSSLPSNDLSLRFSYPFQSEPLSSAVKDTFGGLFLVQNFNYTDFYQREIHPGQSSTFRFREYSFPTFGLGTFVLLVMSWFGIGTLLVSKRKSWAREDSRIVAAAAFSALSFAGLFAFYTRTPWFASRYACDFIPAVATAQLSLVLFAQRLLTTRPLFSGHGPTFLAAAILSAVSISAARIVEARVAPAEGVPYPRQADGYVPLPISGSRLPEFYECDSDVAKNRPINSEIHGNGAGWFRDADCRVGISTTVLLPEARCLSLSVIPFPEVTDLARWRSELEVVEAKQGVSRLSRESIVVRERIAELTFCISPQAKIDPANITLYTVAWLGSGWKHPEARPPFRLTGVRAIRSIKAFSRSD